MIEKIAVNRCSGCGICIDRCNMDVLRFNTQIKQAFIAYREDCMTCFECALSCPEEAITVSFIPGFVPDSIKCLQRGADHG